MKSKIKLRILQILFIISLIITILFINGTFAKYYEQVSTSYNVGVKKWNIIVNGESINSILKNGSISAAKKLNEAVMEVTFPGNEYIAPGAIAPGAEGYLDMEVDYSQVEVPFTFNFEFSETGDLNDLEYYGTVIDDVMYYNLPEGYRQVEYIESTGTQYIDTEFIPNQDTRVIVDYQFTEITSSFLFGIRSNYAVKNYTINVSGSENKIVSSFGNLATYNVPIAVTADTQRHCIDKNNNKVYFDGILKLTHENNEFACSDSLELLAAKHIDTSGYLPSKTKLYSVKIYDDETLIREYIPCYKVNADGSEGDIGLYDLVTDTFFANAGTGTFVKGEDLNIDEVVIDPNIEADTEKKKQVKAYVRWKDDTTSTMNDTQDTNFTIGNKKAKFNAKAIFTQYTGNN